MQHDNSLIILNAVRSLQSQQLVICPTDTVYGLCAHAYSSLAMKKIFFLKRRPMHKPLIILIGDFWHLYTYHVFISSNAHKLMHAFWPGKLSIILPIPHLKKMIGFRLPNHPMVRAIIAANHAPIWATSVNVSGEQSVSSLSQLSLFWRQNVGSVVHAEPLPTGIPSTVVQCTTDNRVCILREGAITATSIQKCIDG